MLKNNIVLVGVCLGIATCAMIFSEINIALPVIKIDLSASVTQLQWIMNIFGVAVCSSLVISGRLADIYGRKRLYLLGVFLMGLSMLGSGLSPSADWIIGFQILLGFAGAIMLPVSQALISNLFAENERSKAVAVWATVVGLAMAIGPLLSAFIVNALGWRWIFLVNVPIVIVSLLIVGIFSPESRSNEKAPSLDGLGALLLGLTIIIFVLAVVQGNSWPTPIILMLYLLSIIGLVALLYVEKKAIQPIIREDLFKNKMFLTAAIGNFSLIFFVWASFFLMPLFFQLIHHDSVMQAGLMMLLVTVPLAIFSWFGSYLYQKYQPKNLILLGFLFLIMSVLMQMNFYPNTSFLFLAVGTAAFGIGWSFIWGPTTTTALSALPKEHAGIASGSFVTIQEIGGTVGLAITVSVVRTHSNLLFGYHRGMWVLLIICLIGLLSALCMGQRIPVQENVNESE